MKNKILTLCMTLCLLTATSIAHAQLINGGISFYGTSTTTTNETEITSIDFADFNWFGKFDLNFPIKTTAEYGDLDTGAWLEYAYFKDLESTDLDTVGTVDNFWIFYGFSFDLVSIDENYLEDVTGGITATLVGSGILSLAGYEDTEYNWVYTTQLMGDMQTSSFSASSSAVPAPAGIALLGLALLGFGAMRRGKNS